jgi:hypothetical protein
MMAPPTPAPAITPGEEEEEEEDEENKLEDEAVMQKVKEEFILVWKYLKKQPFILYIIM